MRRLTIAYLMSRYPAISHTFIFREIQSMRAQGIDVKTASINRPLDLDQMTADEQAEARETLYIKDSSLVGASWAHLRVLVSSPRAYLRMIEKTLRLMWRPHVRTTKIVGYFVEAGILLQWMHREGLDHVHVHFAAPVASVALIAASGKTVSMSLSVHGPDVFYNVDGNFLADKIVEARFIRCISLFCRSQLMMLVPFERWRIFHVVRGGVNLTQFAPRALPKNDIPEILCVGRLVPAKGQHVLLRASHELRKRGVKFRLTCVGDGPDRDSLEALCKELHLTDVVTFTGAIGQDAVHSHYDRADVVVLASFAEGLPAALYEPMAKGIPCISTRIAGIPELIDDGENGFLVAASDMTGLTDRLERLCGDPALRERIGRKARQKIEAEYDLDRNYARLAALFREHA